MKENSFTSIVMLWRQKSQSQITENLDKHNNNTVSTKTIPHQTQ